MHPPIIDLTQVISRQTEGVQITLQNTLPWYLGYPCSAYDLSIQSHVGTYFESPSHLFQKAKDTCDYSVSDLILPALCLHLHQTENRCIDACELEKAAAGIGIEPHCALLVDTHDTMDGFRYFSRDAAEWMADKKIKLFGSNTERYDSGFEKPTGFFIELFNADIPILANIINLDKLPNTGFDLIVMPLHIKGICTVPCRAVAKRSKLLS